MIRSLRPGIYAPLPTFFLKDSEDLDIEHFKVHIVYLARHGVWPVIAGSMGENTHLTHEERVILVQAGRRALDDAGLKDVPIIAGAGAGSTRETINICKEIAQAGADYALVISSGYFAGALTPDALERFWGDISEQSPIPVLAYNYPGASAGIDLSSDLLIRIATKYPNVVGVKLTCGSVGKLARVCSAVTDPKFITAHPRKAQDAPFLALCGFADFLVPSLFVGGHGAITGLANIAPKSVVHLFVTASKSAREGVSLSETRRLQDIIARADATIAKGGIAGTKYLMDVLFGFGGAPRRPLLPFSSEAGQALFDHPDVVDLLQLEKSLP